MTTFTYTQPITYRELCVSDKTDLKKLHDALFPIDYDDSFFENAVTSANDIKGWGAVAYTPLENHLPRTTSTDGEDLIGFITCKSFSLSDVPKCDRQLLGFDDSESEADLTSKVMYILTIGVVDEHRKNGIASKLLQQVEAHARDLNCTTLYLHVISYNEPARQFYIRHGFECITELKQFYCIKTGRAMYPDVTDYNAFVLKKTLSRNDTSVVDMLPISSLIEQFTSACLPFRDQGGYRRTKKAHAPQPPAVTWLRGLFSNKPPSTMS